MIKFVVLCLLSFSLFADETLSTLLQDYKKSAELSKITKKESAGVVDIFTREELEKMQVKNLLDVLKLVSGLHLTRLSNNLTAFSKPTTQTIQLPSVRFYINDHDMSSSSFGSAFLIWGELPLEYIDHIEVYKGSSSIEFGNETASLVIRLYTKQPKREVGNKVRLYADNKNSLSGDIYHAELLENDLEYFAYANLNHFNRTTYQRVYKGKNYDIKSDQSGYNLYFDLVAKSWSFELGSYKKESDNFLGAGIHKTPTGGGMDGEHHYLHFTKNFPSDIKLQLSYDKLSYKQRYSDDNGIKVNNAPLLQAYDNHFDDTIATIILEKMFRYNKHSLFVGTFYKYKKFKATGNYENAQLGYFHTNAYENSLNLYSLYSEYTYRFSDTLRFIGSYKEDFFHYKQGITSHHEKVLRTGIIKNINHWQLKAFLTRSYVPIAFYQLYNPENMPYKTNPALENMKLDLGSLSLNYKKDAQEFSFIVAKNILKNVIIYDKNNGYKNSDTSVAYTRYHFTYVYSFDLANRVLFDFYTGKNSKNLVVSPQYVSFLRLFNKQGKFDIYNELIYKSSYSAMQLDMGASFDYTFALKYHKTKDLSFGLRGENIFHDSFEQVYKFYNQAIPVNDQKFWINMEYLF